MALNTKCPGVKRLMREAAELAEPTEHYHAAPLEDNLFEWHFTVRGQHGTPFQGGLYHGRILFPPNYPLKPPSVILLTPNGRFELNRKICLSISDFHPETWQPSWSIRTVLLALIGFMPTPGNGAIGALDWTDGERRKLAGSSPKWCCSVCGRVNSETLLPVQAPSGSDKIREESEKYASELKFAADKKSPTESSTSDKKSASDKKPATESSTEPAADNETPDEVGLQQEHPPPPPTSPSDESVVPPVTQDTVAAPRDTVAAAQGRATGDRNTAVQEAPSGGGFCSLFLIYLLAGLISGLFLRRVLRSIYDEMWTENPFD